LQTPAEKFGESKLHFSARWCLAARAVGPPRNMRLAPLMLFSVLVSDNMIAFVSPSYFSRLWCVFELATFCKNNEGQLDERLHLFSLKWPTIFNPQWQFGCKKVGLDAEEKSWFENFDCLEVNCAKPSDRAYVLKAIRTEWGSEDEFNKYVRKSLKKQLRRSKKRYANILASRMSEAFDLAFGG